MTDDGETLIIVTQHLFNLEMTIDTEDGITAKYSHPTRQTRVRDAAAFMDSVMHELPATHPMLYEDYWYRFGHRNSRVGHSGPIIAVYSDDDTDNGSVTSDSSATANSISPPPSPQPSTTVGEHASSLPPQPTTNRGLPPPIPQPSLSTDDSDDEEQADEEEGPLKKKVKLADSASAATPTSHPPNATTINLQQQTLPAPAATTVPRFAGSAVIAVGTPTPTSSGAVGDNGVASGGVASGTAGAALAFWSGQFGDLGSGMRISAAAATPAFGSVGFGGVGVGVGGVGSGASGFGSGGGRGGFASFGKSAGTTGGFSSFANTANPITFGALTASSSSSSAPAPQQPGAVASPAPSPSVSLPQLQQGGGGLGGQGNSVGPSGAEQGQGQGQGIGGLVGVVGPAQQLPQDSDETLSTPYPKHKNNHPPSHLLIILALPTLCTTPPFDQAFGRYPGFVRIRLVPGREDIALVEFGNKTQAEKAKNDLDGLDGIVIEFIQR
ncbi:hypothetical protein HDV00_001601 [Rhizophlyctis rosea]|nr:hypothetical protein HDV00_001601 [Rhizophlyctis rosea]